MRRKLRIYCKVNDILQGRDSCKQVRHRDAQRQGRYQLDVMPCDCEKAVESEEDFDGFPNDVIHARWKENTDSNEALDEKAEEEVANFLKKKVESVDINRRRRKHEKIRVSEEEPVTTTLPENENTEANLSEEKEEDLSEEFG